MIDFYKEHQRIINRNYEFINLFELFSLIRKHYPKLSDNAIALIIYERFSAHNKTAGAMNPISWMAGEHKEQVEAYYLPDDVLEEPINNGEELLFNTLRAIRQAGIAEAF
ncbi:hypothetical protein [Avibacterium paragallinarum]|uniref:hypothetical protein n=1 Tax=Avibacterium paragallinarum TaxID=728 RepID=UPI00397AC9F8